LSVCIFDLHVSVVAAVVVNDVVADYNVEVVVVDDDNVDVVVAVVAQ
jgi:hypothetical protein